MNEHRKLVVLNDNIVRVSRQYGEAMAKWYATPEGAASASRSRSGEWGAELDPIRQGQGKAGEYAVALHFALDLSTAVSRRISVADGGTDVTLAAGFALDVKTTPQHKRWLIWSRQLNDLYERKRFDYLVGVSIDDGDWSQCWIEGYISKVDFFERKKIADGISDDGKLSKGTWFIEKSDLIGIDLLLAGFVGYDTQGRLLHYCHCGKWGAHGVGVSVLKQQLGAWFCAEHKPENITQRSHEL